MLIKLQRLWHLNILAKDVFVKGITCESKILALFDLLNEILSVYLGRPQTTILVSKGDADVVNSAIDRTLISQFI